jgi:nitrate reductase gamma subunit
MSGMTFFFTALAYVAGGIFVIGFGTKVLGYLRTPSRWKVAITPAPTTKAGAAWRIAKEVLFFRSLFKGNRWTWLAGYAMHILLAITIVRHGLVLIGIPRGENDLSFSHLGPMLGPVVQLYWDWTFRAGPLFIGALFAVLIRRFWVDRTRYISTPADYLHLVLLIVIAVTGVLMKYVFHPDVEAIHDFLFGLALFHFVSAPDAWSFLFHFGMVMVLLMVFPFSKLMHMGGVFLGPMRNTPDDPADRFRHAAGQAARGRES